MYYGAEREKERQRDTECDRETEIDKEREEERDRDRDREGERDRGESFSKLGMMVNAGAAETGRSLKLAGQIVLPNG